MTAEPSFESIAAVYNPPAALRLVAYNEAMEITVLLFASVAEKAGTRKFTLELDEPATVASARDAILARYPSLEPFAPNLLYALDEEYARESDQVVVKLRWSSIW